MPLGLQDGARRQTPGLRCEEVGQLSGLSATGHAWLEQGCAMALSPATLGCRLLALGPCRACLSLPAGLPADIDGAEDAVELVPPAVPAAVGVITAPAYRLNSVWTACGRICFDRPATLIRPKPSRWHR
jgi:hypothetical protein